MVPEAEFSSYYGRPVVKEATWAPLDIAGYLFLGGLAGASSRSLRARSSAAVRTLRAP